MKLGPTVAWNSMGVAQARGRHAEAARLRKIIDETPLEDCLANAHLHLGRLDEAIAEYQRVLRLNPNDALSRHHLALAFERKGTPQLARVELMRFLEIWKGADANLRELKDARARLAHLRDRASDTTF